MHDLIYTELVKAGFSVATDVINRFVHRKNEELLEKKKEKNKLIEQELTTRYENKRQELKNFREKQQSSEIGRISLEMKKITQEKDRILNEKKQNILNQNEKFEADFIVNEKRTIENLKAYAKSAKDWCKSVHFVDLSNQKLLKNIYIELDTYLMPISTHLSRIEKFKKNDLMGSIFNDIDEQHCIILGQPGAGKTTSMKKVCSLFFDKKSELNYSFPIVLKFRVLASNESEISIVDLLSKIVVMDFTFNDIELNININKKDLILSSRLSFLDALKPIIILDGFDETPSARIREDLLEEIRFLNENLINAKVVTTCRTGQFKFSIANTKTYEIAPLSKMQVQKFVKNWIMDEVKSRKFLQEIYESPFADTSIKPLSLAHLCAIYERSGSIPEKPKTVYKKVVNLMLEEWDTQRSVKRESKYSNFSSDRKFEFLCNLSFQLTISRKNTIFTKEQLIKAYSEICGHFSLPASEGPIAAAEIESHTGLLVQTGYQEYEFAHKSLQEYLTAEYLALYPALDRLKEHFELLGSEMAIATVISSDASVFFSEIVLNIFNKADLSILFYDAFIDRLVQERPDFNTSDDLVLASFSLLSIKSNEPNYIPVLNKMLLKNDSSVLWDYYALEDSVSSNWVFLNRIKEHERYSLKKKLRIPNEIFSQKLL